MSQPGFHTAGTSQPDVPSTVGSASNDDALDSLLKSAAVLVVDDEPGMRNFLKRALEKRCALLEVAGSAEEAEALRLRIHFDLLLVDIKLPGISGLEWLGQLRERGVRTHVIYMTAFADLEMAVNALRNGADDFVMKPFRAEQIFLSIQRSLGRQQILRENSLLRFQLQHVKQDTGVVGESQPIKDTLALAQRVAPTQTTVLIQGETGTGKELIARTIHASSQRGGGFVAINCGTIAPDLFESELFGHIKGAFTGAMQARDGLLFHADKGTLFLDEIGELPAAMQAKLLRFLEERVIRPVGSEREVPVDVRIVAATNRDLGELAEAGRFRQDLFFRLHVLLIQVPPLRQRMEDVELLIAHFMKHLSAEMRLAPIEFMHTDWQKLKNYHWPGNVRELRNLVERTLLLGGLPADSLNHLPVDSSNEVGNASSTDQAPAVERGFPNDWPMAKVEREHIESVLASVNYNKSAAARLLCVSRKTLERKVQLWSSDTTADDVANNPPGEEVSASVGDTSDPVNPG